MGFLDEMSGTLSGGTPSLGPPPSGQGQDFMAQMSSVMGAGRVPTTGGYAEQETVGGPESRGRFAVPEGYEFLPAEGRERRVDPTPETEFVRTAMPELGTFAREPSDPQAIVRSARTSSEQMRRDLLEGLPAWNYEIDHKDPLWLGGSSTDPYNLERLTKEDHEKKTRVGAAVRALFDAGKIGTPEARTLVANWRDLDDSGIRMGQFDDGSYGTDLETGMRKLEEWRKGPKPDYAGELSKIWHALPIVSLLAPADERRETQEQFSRQLAKLAPDNPFGEFMKGAASGLSMGHLQAIPEEYEEELEGAEGFAASGARALGNAVGFVASFGPLMKGLSLISKPLSLTTGWGKIAARAAGDPGAKGAVPWIRGKFANWMHMMPGFAVYGQLSAQERDDVMARVERVLDDAQWAAMGAVVPSALAYRKVGVPAGRLAADSASALGTAALIRADGGSWEEAIQGGLIMGALHHWGNSRNDPRLLGGSEQIEQMATGKSREYFAKLGIEVPEGKISPEEAQRMGFEAKRRISGRKDLNQQQKANEVERAGLLSRILAVESIPVRERHLVMERDFKSLLQRLSRMSGESYRGLTKEEMAVAKAVENEQAAEPKSVVGRVGEKVGKALDRMRPGKRGEDRKRGDGTEVSRLSKEEADTISSGTFWVTGAGSDPELSVSGLSALKEGRIGEGDRVYAVRRNLSPKEIEAVRRQGMDIGPSDKVIMIIGYSNWAKRPYLLGYMPTERRITQTRVVREGGKEVRKKSQQERVEELNVAHPEGYQIEMPKDAINNEVLYEIMRSRDLSVAEGIIEKAGKSDIGHPYFRVRVLPEGIEMSGKINADYRKLLAESGGNLEPSDYAGLIPKILGKTDASVPAHEMMGQEFGNVSRIGEMAEFMRGASEALASGDRGKVRRFFEERAGIRLNEEELGEIMGMSSEARTGNVVDLVRAALDSSRVAGPKVSEMEALFSEKGELFSSVGSGKEGGRLMQLPLGRPKAAPEPKPPKAAIEAEVPREPATQEEAVSESVKSVAKSIGEVAQETGILEPNVRRILGVGAKSGKFERVDRGVYVLRGTESGDIAYLQTGDALATVPLLAKQGFKADMVFLDIPYDTKAVKGGNRGVKYGLISSEQFSRLLDDVMAILRDDNSSVVYMYSKAPSGMKEMSAYNKALTDRMTPVGSGEFTKMQRGAWKPVTNVLGRTAAPEGLIVLNRSGKVPDSLNLNLKFRRPAKRTYVDESGVKRSVQSEKPLELLNSLIEQTTKKGDTVFDPFLGSGVTMESAVASGRKAAGIEKNPELVEKVIKPRVEEAAKRLAEDIEAAESGKAPKKKAPTKEAREKPDERPKRMTADQKRYALSVGIGDKVSYLGERWTVSRSPWWSEGRLMLELKRGDRKVTVGTEDLADGMNR